MWQDINSVEATQPKFLVICEGGAIDFAWFSEGKVATLSGSKAVKWQPMPAAVGVHAVAHKIASTADFLFPRDLEVHSTKFKKFLIVGSCMSEIYHHYFEWKNPGLEIDHILFNNPMPLPHPPSPLEDYDFQFIQMPLRSVLSDEVIRIGDINPEKILSQGVANIDAMMDASLRYLRESGLLTFISNFVVPQSSVAASLHDYGSRHDLTALVRELNSYLAHCVRSLKNTYIIDAEAIASSVGKRYFMDDFSAFTTHGSVFSPVWHEYENTAYWTAPAPGRLENVPHVGLTYESKAGDFYDAIYRQIEAIYRTINQVDAVKMVIFDLDNTLWRGQLIEHYQTGLRWPIPDGWPLGVWEAVQHLKARGIILAISSKNDLHLVTENWSKAVNPPWLNLSDFQIQSINWQPKAANIANIINAVSLTPKSVLFVDDNPIERKSVQEAIPGIRVIGSNPFMTKRVLMWAPELQIARLSDESKRRGDAIVRQFQRESVKATMSRSEFLQSLDSKMKFQLISGTADPKFDRSFDLLNKTNQFNTTGKRWTFQEIQAFLQSGGNIACFSVADNFVNYGLVGVMLISGSHIEQFAMSCRVLGMGIEVAAITHALKSMPESVTASMTYTDANTVCRDVFTRSGFSFLEGNRQTYVAGPIDDFSHIEIEDASSPGMNM